MKERPILFSAPMVRAILDGSKTQTRRVMRDQVCGPGIVRMARPGYCEIVNEHGVSIPGFYCPYGQPGDRLWVRETWAIASKATDLVKVYYAACASRSHTEFHECFPVELAAGMKETWPKYRPSIHMPRWASRITLEITGVRVERLNEISDDDISAEGIQEIIDAGVDHDGWPRDAFRSLWEQINGAGSWAVNPWVWVIEFKRVMEGQS